MDLSPTVLIVAAVVLLALLAWAYFDVPDTDTI